MFECRSVLFVVWVTTGYSFPECGAVVEMFGVGKLVDKNIVYKLEWELHQSNIQANMLFSFDSAKGFWYKTHLPFGIPKKGFESLEYFCQKESSLGNNWN